MIFRHSINRFLISKSLCNVIIKRCFGDALGKPRNRNLNKIWSQKHTSEQYFYINDNRIAQMVLNHLNHDLPNEKSIIFEASPGTGILTTHLLRNGAPLVRVFEENQQFLAELNKLKTSYPNQLQIIDKQILNLPNITYKYWDFDEHIVNSMFADVPNNSWRSSPSIKFVAVLSPNLSAKFLRFVIKQLTQFDLFFSKGRTQFLVFISEKECNYMTAKPSENMIFYRSCTVLYNTLFDIEVLETVPYSAFAAYTKIQQKSKSKMEEITKLVRLTPKLCLAEFDSEMLMDYHYFVSQTFMKRRNWVIPFLEKWFPNCGPQLIKMGIPVFKCFGDLTPQEVFDIFLHFIKPSDYRTSLFKSLAASNQLFATDSRLDEEVNEAEDTKDLFDHELLDDNN